MTLINVFPIAKAKISRFQGIWSPFDYKALIELLGGDYSGLVDSELEEYLLMTISDCEVDESAYELLKYRIGDLLSKGQLENLSHEMENDKMWEEFPDMSLHKEIFIVNQMLYEAYHGRVPKGEMLKISLNAETKDPHLYNILKAKDADALLRIVINGCDDHSILNRLFDEEQISSYLTDAKSIIWNSKSKSISATSLELEIISSMYWLKDFQINNPYEVSYDIELYSHCNTNSNTTTLN